MCSQPSGDRYLVNQVPWLYYDRAKATWKGGYKGQQAPANYDAAALAVANGIVAGLEVRLYDTDKDGYHYAGFDNEVKAGTLAP